MAKAKHHFIKEKIVLFLILVLALILRVYGLNWDQNQHLHPDERFLTMVVTSLKLPKNLPEYLNPKISPMNPYNAGYGFFVYGTFPVYLTKIFGQITHNSDYGRVHLVGRLLSAIFDLGVVFLLFKISQKVFDGKTGLIAAFLYAIMVLPIQLSHFFAVDTFLNFFIILSFYLLLFLIFKYPSVLISSLLGATFGLAIACKFSALYFLPVIGLGYLSVLFLILFSKSPASLKSVKFFYLIICGVIFVVTAILVFRINQPQAFFDNNYLNWQPNPRFINNLKEARSYDNPKSFFPPAIQWKRTKPILFPLKNMILWGLGLPLGIIAVVSVLYTIVSSLFNLLDKNKKGDLNSRPDSRSVSNLIVIWILTLLAYQGSQFSKTMRYFLTIYPFLAVLSAKFLVDFAIFLRRRLPKSFRLLSLIFYLTVLVYPISFMTIYSRPISRVSASKWIYKNIPAGATILEEEWDDGLPLPLPNYPWEIYKKEPVLMYDLDTPEKWQKINQKLEKVDYIILTSNRAYGSTMKIPEDYPQTIRYYQSLFESSGNFKKIVEFTSRPCFPPIGRPLFCFVDDNADEAFTVYDHPKVMIFQKKQ